jgi:hypothetical protein
MHMVNVWNVGVIFLVCFSSVLAQPAIAIINPSFEDVDPAGRPLHWKSWNSVGVDIEKTCSVVERSDAPNGKRVAQLAPTSPQITIFSQNLENLVPGQWYEISGRIKSEKAVGHGARLGIEYWQGSVAYGSLDAEPIVGTTDWTTCVVRFQAPSKQYRVQLDFCQTGNSGTVWMDNLRIRNIPQPSFDVSKRRTLDTPFWGMFTCNWKWYIRYAKEMKDAGVYWQRMGLGSTSPDVQKLAKELGMVFAACIDAMPGPADPNDPCYPVTHSAAYLAFIKPFIEKPAPQVRIWELFNEPNLRHDWTLDGYANLLKVAGKAIKDTKTNVLVGTGGFGLPYTGFLEACLKRDKNKLIDIALIHPYCVDEALDSHLWAVTEACNRAGRPEVAVAINETGWPTWDPATGYKDYSQFVTEETQSRNIVKMHIQGLAHKLSFVTYLGWNDFPEVSDQAHNMGLIRVDGSAKPSYHAYRFMTKTIGQRRIGKWSYLKDGTRTYRFTGDKPVWAVWNALQDTKITVDTGTTEVFIYDIYGVKLTVQPVHGKVELNAGDKPVYLVPAEL